MASPFCLFALPSFPSESCIFHPRIASSSSSPPLSLSLSLVASRLSPSVSSSKWAGVLCTLSQAVQRVHKPLWSAKKKNGREERAGERIYCTLTRPKARPVNIDHIPICWDQRWGSTCWGSHTAEARQRWELVDFKEKTLHVHLHEDRSTIPAIWPNDLCFSNSNH